MRSRHRARRASLPPVRVALIGGLLLASGCSSLLGIEEYGRRDENVGGTADDAAGASALGAGAGLSPSGGSGGAAHAGSSASGGRGGLGEGGGLGGFGESGGPGQGGEPGTSGSGAEGGACSGGACVVAPSCAAMNGSECQGRSCCESSLVPGGTFSQGGPEDPLLRATVSDFRLDDYEVTVGRFRPFVAGYDAWRVAGNPQAGAGAHPLIEMSGWRAEWSDALPGSAATLRSPAGLQCEGTFATWLDAGNDTLPLNCVSWYLAFAFCAWDGGRLPTEAEWEYAAAGGDEDRDYPWGSAPIPDDLTASHAVYYCLGNGSAECEFADLLPVGSKPLGQGRYGQFDLAGSLQEWTLDWFAEYPLGVSQNYARIDSGSMRVSRGGDFANVARDIVVHLRQSQEPVGGRGYIGLRCARSP